MPVGPHFSAAFHCSLSRCHSYVFPLFSVCEDRQESREKIFLGERAVDGTGPFLKFPPCMARRGFLWREEGKSVTDSASGRRASGSRPDCMTFTLGGRDFSCWRIWAVLRS